MVVFPAASRPTCHWRWCGFERRRSWLSFPSLCLPPSTMPTKKKTAAVEKASAVARSTVHCSLLSPLWSTRPPQYSLRAREGKKAKKRGKGEGAPPFPFVRRGHPMPSLLVLLSLSTAVVAADANKKNTCDALQDALACGRLAAFLSSFQARVSRGAEPLHAYAALEGPGGDGRKRYRGS